MEEVATFLIPVADLRFYYFVDVLTLETRDRDECAVLFRVVSALGKEGLESITNFIVAILTPSHGWLVHLVDDDYKLVDAQALSKLDVLSCLTISIETSFEFTLLG